MPVNKKDLVLVLLFLVMGISVFFLGRNSHPVKDEVKLPDNSRFEKSIDCLAVLNNELKNTNKGLFITLDSLRSVKIMNTKKVTNEVKKINNFTPTDIHRWNDSVLSAQGLK